MSAYLCDAPTLAALAREVAKMDSQINAEHVFQMLLDENLASIGYRYPDAPHISDWFSEGEAAFIWERIPDIPYTATAILEKIREYQYQSCEHPQWEESDARKITDLLARSLADQAKAEKQAEYEKVRAREAAISKLPTLYPKDTAAHFRTLLKAKFPATKFRVITERGSMVSSVRISWTDGPTQKQVDALTAGFIAGHFDGMTDSYDYHRDRVIQINGKSYQPGCNYIFTNRTISADLANRCIAQIVRYWGGITAAPVAIPNPHGGDDYTLEPDGWRNIRADVPIDWHTAIHRAASDRTTYQRAQDPTRPTSPATKTRPGASTNPRHLLSNSSESHRP